MSVHEHYNAFEQAAAATDIPTVKQDKFTSAANAGGPQDDHLSMSMEVDEETKHDDGETAEAPQQETPWVNASEVFPEQEPQHMYNNPQSVLAFIAPGSVIDAHEPAERLRETKKVIVARDGEEASQALRHLSAPDIVFVETIDSLATAKYLSKLAPTKMISIQTSGTRNVLHTSDVEAFFANNSMYCQCLLGEKPTVSDAAMIAEVVLFNPSVEIISVS